jgi:hypothetical protein
MEDRVGEGFMPMGSSSVRQRLGTASKAWWITCGLTANLQLFVERIRRAQRYEPHPMGGNSTAPECVARHCGFAEGAGSMAVTIDTVTVEAGVDARMPARCVLHESFHAAFTRLQ